MHVLKCWSGSRGFCRYIIGLNADMSVVTITMVKMMIDLALDTLGQVSRSSDYRISTLFRFNSNFVIGIGIFFFPEKEVAP